MQKKNVLFSNTRNAGTLLLYYLLRNISTPEPNKTSLTNSRGSRVPGPKVAVAGPMSRSRVQCRGRGSKVAVAGPMSRQGKMIWGF